MTLFRFGLMLALVTGAATVGAQRPPGIAPVERLSPRLDAIIDGQARLEPLRQDYFGANEGTAWVRDPKGGFLLFSDMGANRIYKWTPARRELSVFLEKSGFTGTDISQVRALDNGRLLVSPIGSNAIAIDRDGRVVFCTHGDRSLVRLEKDGSRTTLVDRWEGKRLNGPNDLAIRSDGSIYFTDFGAGLRGGVAKSPDRELDFQGVFRWKPDGSVQLVFREATNGIAFSPDERYVYTTGGGGFRRHEVQPDGSLGPGTLFIDMRGQALKGGSDGFKVDREGVIFTTGPGGIWIVGPDGTHLGSVRTPDGNATESGTNLAFGDDDGRGLYLVTLRSLYHLRLKRPAW